MNKADEKSAFDQMMDEISESDSDDEQSNNRNQKKNYSSAAVSKNVSKKSAYKDNKESSNWSSPHRNSFKTTQDEEIENFGRNTGLSEEPLNIQQTSEQISFMKRWLLRPCLPGDPPILCYVERHRNGFGQINSTYKCFIEGIDGQNSRFIMTAKKKNSSKTSYYLISMDEDEQGDRGSESVVGKVRGNSIGSQYLITDSGLAPNKAVVPSMLRKVIVMLIILVANLLVLLLLLPIYYYCC